MSARELVKQLQYPNYVPPTDDYNTGRRMFQAAAPYSECGTIEMQSGWLAAEEQAALAEYQDGGWQASDALLAVTI